MWNSGVKYLLANNVRFNSTKHNGICRGFHYYYYYLLQLGCYPVALVILHVDKT